MMQLGLLKPGGRAAHRFYVLAMARRRGSDGGGEGGDGGGDDGDGGGTSGGDGGASGGRNTSVVGGGRRERTHASTGRARQQAARRARKASAGEGGAV